MEDLGNICVREFWNPSGGLTGLCSSCTSSRAGIPYDRDATMYYRVQQNVRGMIPIHAVTVMAHPREPWPGSSRIATSVIERRARHCPRRWTFRSTSPRCRRKTFAVDPLAEAARYALANDVAPNVSGAFAQSRANDVNVLIDCMDRRRRYAATLAEIERDELSDAARSQAEVGRPTDCASSTSRSARARSTTPRPCAT
jgi:hypothetical protein